jgi:adenylate cyclase
MSPGAGDGEGAGDGTERLPSRWSGEILESLETGVALLFPGETSPRYGNPRFREWFPGDGDLLARLGGEGGLPPRARERLDRNRAFRTEVEVRKGPRTVTLEVELRSVRGGDDPAILVEARNVSKRKEAEYLLDSYSRISERQTRELELEKERVEKLLLNIMPRRVYEELKDSGTTSPQTFESASVLLLDFAGFTDMAISRDPGALIAELNDIFTSFDRIADHFHCERIKTIGDAYMAVAGLPDPDPDHAVHLARAALRIRRFLERRNGSSRHQWQSRIGMGSGPVIGSIVGIQKYVYDIFGPAVNMSARLEALADPMQILVSAEMAGSLRDEFVLRSLGSADIKGFGPQEVFALEDEVRKGH